MALRLGSEIIVAFAIVQLSFSAMAGDRVPPKLSYHFGEQKYLLRNAKIDEVPEEDWKTHIMGEGTTYDLPNVRRGLYVGTDLTTISHYTPNCGTGKTPWVKAIHLKEECRDPKVVGDISNLSSDKRFKEWFDKQFNKEELAKLILNSPVLQRASDCEKVLGSYDQFVDSAFEYSGRPRIRYHKWHKIQGANEHTEVHEYVIDEWIKFNGFRVMLNDNAHEKPSQQWYIRDRSCIEKIDGTPEEVLRMVADRSDFFFSFRQVRDGAREKIVDDYDSTATIFLRALSEAESLDPKLLKSIRDAVKNESTRMPAEWRPAFLQILSAVSKCGKKKNYRSALEPAIQSYENLCMYFDFNEAADRVEKACK